MIFVDTGFFLALFNPKDELHGRAEAWAEAVSEPLLVTEYVLWECVNALSLPADRPTAHHLVEYVRAAGGFEVIAASPAWWAAGLALHRSRLDKAWSLTDCISFEVMRDRDVRRALAHDRHFEQAGFEALLRREP